jgi:hypothetical protein
MFGDIGMIMQNEDSDVEELYPEEPPEDQGKSSFLPLGFFTRLFHVLTDEDPPSSQSFHTNDDSFNPSSLTEFLVSLFTADEPELESPSLQHIPLEETPSKIPEDLPSRPATPLNIPIFTNSPDSVILTTTLASNLIPYLPPLPRQSVSWVCRHATSRDGTSLSNLYFQFVN